MAGRDVKIKVQRDKLVQKLREERERLVKNHEKNEEKYLKDTAAFRKRFLSEVDKFVTLLEADPDKAFEDRVSSNYSKGAYVEFRSLKPPAKPTLDTRMIDKHIRVLEMSNDETISVSADDVYASYL